ncbi:MAG: winged helix-turn-helix transcriptional regulator [Hungatella sp.]|nr:winged helix-turn-helix transcriptional regulator [Hungatella sp.]
MASILADSNSYSIKVAVFRGRDKTDLIKRNEYGYKCMLVAVKQVLDYMEALNDTVVDVGGSLRQERQMFDFSCFREAWLNACLHNRWSRQTPPAVYMFDDRIEIISMGGLPDGLTLDEFYEGKSKPVNLELQQIMVQLDYIEQTGHGVPLIVSKYGKEVFDITENFITVTIPLNKAVKKNLQKTKEYVLNECDKKILNLIKENSYITVHELSGRIGIGMTTVMKHIRVLKEKGVVERRGSKKKGQWIVREEIL